MSKARNPRIGGSRTGGRGNRASSRDNASRVFGRNYRPPAGCEGSTNVRISEAEWEEKRMEYEDAQLP